MSKRKDLYRPSNKDKYDSKYCFSRFISQFIDKNDWGIKKWHHARKEKINENLASNTAKHQLKRDEYYEFKPFVMESKNGQEVIKRDKNGKALRKEAIVLRRYQCIETHLRACQNKDKANYIYYTNSPFKQYNLICLDIDRLKSGITTTADLDATAEYLSDIFPNCYHDCGSSGKSLHFYIIVEYDLIREFDLPVDVGKYRNALSKKLGDSLEVVINENFVVDFDAVKATCCRYSGVSQLDSCGVLCKLPIPSTTPEFDLLYNCSVYTEDDICSVINDLSSYVDLISSGISSFPTSSPFTLEA